MAVPHDPAYEMRRVLWLSYGLLAIGVVLFFAALILFGYHQSGIQARPLAPPSASASQPGGETAINPAPGANPPGQADGSRPVGSASSGNPTLNGSRPGAPPVGVEDEPATTPAPAAAPPPTSHPGLSLPQLPLPPPPPLGVVPSLPLR